MKLTEKLWDWYRVRNGKRWAIRQRQKYGLLPNPRKANKPDKNPKRNIT